jgi:N6-L-threonylcarbamoyladenine synthase
MVILGIDTSCDDTSVAVLDDRRILSNVVSSQVPLHQLFGGVVPEIASRKHVENIDIVFKQALEKANVTLNDIEILSVTQGPGLIGSVLAGLCFVKGLSLATVKPMIGVNHVEAHSLAIFLEEEIEFPYMSLIVSGGHSAILYISSPGEFKLIGTTRDDAAGEAFDKIAKYLNLGYPGGKIVGELAAGGNPKAIAFPRPMGDESHFDFSFSGLKTAFINYVKKSSITDDNRSDILASFQEAACDVLTAKTVRAARSLSVKKVVLGGGVAALGRLRQMMTERCADHNISVSIPSPALCTDNGAMVAVAAGFYARKQAFSPLNIKAYARIKWI